MKRRHALISEFRSLDWPSAHNNVTLRGYTAPENMLRKRSLITIKRFILCEIKRARWEKRKYCFYSFEMKGFYYLSLIILGQVFVISLKWLKIDNWIDQWLLVYYTSLLYLGRNLGTNFKFNTLRTFNVNTLVYQKLWENSVLSLPRYFVY